MKKRVRSNDRNGAGAVNSHQSPEETHPSPLSRAARGLSTLAIMDAELDCWRPAGATASVEELCDFLNNPTMWSDEFIQATLERSGTQVCNADDCRTLVRDYLAVVREYVRQAGPDDRRS